jgi:hypothetical protein
VKIRSVRHNNRKKVFELGTATKKLVFPFSQTDPTPTIDDPIDDVFVDPEAGREAFTCVSAWISARSNPRATLCQCLTISERSKVRDGCRAIERETASWTGSVWCAILR